MTTVPPKRRNRTTLPPEDILIPVCIRLSPAQKQKLMRLGGGSWLRERLRRTVAPSGQTHPASTERTHHVE